MGPDKNRQWRLARRPERRAQPTDFQWAKGSVPRPAPDQALVRNKLLSLDPTNRIVKQYNALLDNLNTAVLDRFAGSDHSAVFEKDIQA